MTADFIERYENCRKLVENALESRLRVMQLPHAELTEAMAYSVLNGGKRLRAVLTLEFCRMCSGTYEMALDYACAVEMLHAYSLIHDDMPCMDNSDMRRGKPSNHMVYGQWLALLAGDALQAEAFAAIADAPLGVEKNAEAISCFAKAAGRDGICGGQYLDLKWEGRQLDEVQVRNTHSMKTAALIKAAALLGCIAAGADEKQKEAASEFAQAFGLAFQIRDDMLDESSTAEEFGKNVGKDADKTTFCTLYGLEKCGDIVGELSEKARSIIKKSFDMNDFMCALIDDYEHRKA